ARFVGRYEDHARPLSPKGWQVAGRQQRAQTIVHEVADVLLPPHSAADDEQILIWVSGSPPLPPRRDFLKLSTAEIGDGEDGAIERERVARAKLDQLVQQAEPQQTHGERN